MISIYLNGRLGNQLFQYTFCRISALKNKCNFFIPSNKTESIEFYSQCNNKLFSNLFMSEETNPHYWVGDKLFDVDLGVNDNIINRIVSEKDINCMIKYEQINNGDLIKGYCQFEDILIGYEDLIKNEWFKIKPNILESSLGITNTYNVNDYCIIHFRGGDYKTIDMFYLPKTYYDYAKSKMPKNIKYLIITDDIVEAKKFFPDDKIISNTMEIDFCLLTLYKYIIISNSTFSWWGSWLNNNNPIVIAPNRWFNYKTEGDFFPIGMKSNKFYYI
jgi:hypothetical protein